MAVAAPPPQSGQLTDPLGKGHLVQARKKIEAGSWAHSTVLCAAQRSTRGGPFVSKALGHTAPTPSWNLVLSAWTDHLGAS